MLRPSPCCEWQGLCRVRPQVALTDSDVRAAARWLRLVRCRHNNTGSETPDAKAPRPAHRHRSLAKRTRLNAAHHSDKGPVLLPENAPRRFRFHAPKASHRLHWLLTADHRLLLRQRLTMSHLAPFGHLHQNPRLVRSAVRLAPHCSQSGRMSACQYPPPCGTSDGNHDMFPVLACILPFHMFDIYMFG